MLLRCSLRKCLWVAVPLVAGHLACLAIPVMATVAVGVPVLMPICASN